jgi:hypothetical protein
MDFFFIFVMRRVSGVNVTRNHGGGVPAERPKVT